MHPSYEELAMNLLIDKHTGMYQDATKGSLFFVTKKVYPSLSWVKPVKVAYKDHVFF